MSLTNEVMFAVNERSAHSPLTILTLVARLLLLLPTTIVFMISVRCRHDS